MLPLICTHYIPFFFLILRTLNLVQTLRGVEVDYLALILYANDLLMLFFYNNFFTSTFFLILSLAI